MKLFPKIVTSVVFATITTASMSAISHAATISKQLEFTTSNQSIWDTGPASTFTWGGQDGFLGLDWDNSSGVGAFGIGVNAFTNGKIGLQNNLNLSSGSVSANIPINLFLTIPDQPVQTDETFNIQSGFSFGNGASFNTIGLTASYNLDFLFNVAAGLNFNPGPDFGFKVNETLPLISFGPGNPIQIDGNLGSLSVSSPVVNTQGTLSASSNMLNSSGQDEILQGSLDLDRVATDAFGLPPLQAEGEIDLFITDVGYSYNLLDIRANAALSLIQNFALTGSLPGLLILEDGTKISFNVGDTIPITLPRGVNDTLDINAAIDFNALFKNTTSLGFDFDLGVTALQASLSRFNIGPLFQDSFSLFDTSFKVYDKSPFQLAGFNSQKFSFQVPVAVPESSSVSPILTLGILGAGLLLKRKLKQKSTFSITKN